MNRKSFIKNSLMSLAIVMLPKILRAVDGELLEGNEIIGDERWEKITDLPDELKQSVQWSYSDSYVIGTVYCDESGRINGIAIT